MGSTARPRYIGLREISERDILELYCITELLSDLKCLICPLSQFQSVFRIIMVRKAQKAVVIQ